MKGNHPKRRKDKYNPYSIFEFDDTGRYFVDTNTGNRIK